MKRILALLLCILLVLTTFSGCLKKKSGTRTEDTSAYELLYAPVLKKYKQALDETWPRDKYLNAGLSPRLASLDKSAAPSFAFLDLDGDKTPELFIGRADQPAAVFDLYTTDGESIKQLLDAPQEPALTLTDDRRLVETDNDTYESLDVTTFYELQDGDLAKTDSYIHDAAKIIDGADEWYHATGALPESETEFYADALDVITKETYDEGTTGYTEAVLPMKEFAELVLPETKDPLEEAKALYAPVIAKYIEELANLTFSSALGELYDKNSKYADDNLVVNSSDYSICYMFGLDHDGQPGYMIKDIDDDGTPEMITGIIGSSDPMIYDLFTLKDAVPFKITQSFERSQLYLLPDGRIARYNHGGAFDNQMKFFEYHSGVLQCVETYFMENRECFHITGDAYSDKTQWQPISQQALEEVYNMEKAPLDLMPFDAAEPADAPAPTDLDTLGERLYASVIEEYRVRALKTEGSYGYYSALSSGTPGYAFTDLDHNGVPEMAVCSQWSVNEPAAIVDLYSADSGKPKVLIDAFEISSMDICTDGRVLWEEAGNVFVYLRINGGNLQFDEAYEIDYNGSSQSYFHVTAGNYVSSDGTFNWDGPDATESQKISKTDFERGKDHEVLALNIKPFSMTTPGMSLQAAYQSVMQATKDTREDKRTQLEYAMHDIDEDGTEELLILDKYHGFNAAGNYRLFTYRGGVAIYLGELAWNEGILLLDGSERLYLHGDYDETYGEIIAVENDRLNAPGYDTFSSSALADFGAPVSFTAF